MSIFGAMFSGVTGLRANSTSLAIIADNISNLNTTGYKGSINRFATLVTAQATKTSYTPGGVLSRPIQLISRQGLLETSESETDIAITGGGFFVVNTNAAGGSAGLNLFTRAGSFTTDLDGNLVNTAGFFLQGWPTDSAGAVLAGLSTSTLDDLQTVNVNLIRGSASATSSVSIGANLPASATTGDTFATNIVIFDSLGIGHNLGLTWIKSGANQWDIQPTPPSGSAVVNLDDLSGAVYASAGRIDFTGQPSDGDTIVIGGTTYEFDNDASVGGGNTAVTIGSDLPTTLGSLVTAVGDSRVTQGTGTNTSTIFLANQPPSSTILTTSTGGAAVATLAVTGSNQLTPEFTVAGGPSGAAGETYTVDIRGTSYTYTTLAAGETVTTIAAGLASAINTGGNGLFSASNAAGVLSVTVGAALAFNTSGTLVTASAALGTLTVGALAASVPAITFSGDGTPAGFNVSSFDSVWTNGASASTAVTLDFGTIGVGDGLTQFSDVFTTNFIQQNGVPFGVFSGVTIGDDGLVTALFDNGEVRGIFQIPIATFSNPNALGAASGNVYRTTEDSGDALVNLPGIGPAGKINSGALEASTVDLAQEFTRMIVTQRAFSAASKIITTADEMLDELTRIKR